MEEVVKKIRKVIVKQQEILFEQLNFGACEASITAFKSKIHLEVPELFYEFYQVFNGSVDRAKPAWGKMIIMPLSSIINEKEKMDRSSKNLNWNKNWLPFLMEDKGSNICSNLENGEGFGNIIQYNCKKSFQPVLFSSFKQWLEAFYEIVANFDKDIVIDNNLYRSYFNSKIVRLIQKQLTL